MKLNNDFTIKDNSEVLYASSIGVGADDNNKEIRLLLFNNKLILCDDELKMIKESNMQIIINKNTANELKSLLDEYLK